MRATANPAPIRNDKCRLLETCAIVAGLAALAYGGPALAQVAGTGQAVTGPGLSAPTISPPGPGPTTVDTTGAQTIIDWTPSNTPVGGVIDFLPTGNSLNFTGTGQYIVLNRFVSGAGLPIADQIAINYQKADITPRQKAMLNFAMQVSVDAASVSEDDFEEIASHGFSNDDIWDITAIAAFFALSNRMANVTSMKPNDEFYMMGRVPK